ncbi:SPFH domain-containing protein [Actinorugispora endophytica]|uniref:Putative membrane protein YqiK n=1 Tax=Actinorugispora endophytica TaxID=1605990 RepID=A0A4R6V080_9ACTN|nr:flotillin family protein [Actinorugispora endophytica]TDQ53085.1 putative membrane protein YqiK [Actinorugispora endophytica]
METITAGVGVLIAVLLLVLLGLLFVISRLFRKVEQGKALIVSKVTKVDVTFTGAVVLPVLHKAEVMDISVKTIDIARTGKEGLICRDNIRADIRITFFVRVNKTTEDVIKVAQAIGTERASDQSTLQELFNAKFSEALKTVGKHLDFEDLYTKRDEFRDRIIHVIGTDLNGYSLEDAAIDYLEQTPMTQLDSANILDAQGIRKITELTALQSISTNEHRRNEEKELERQNVEARETILELERRREEAETRQKREVESLRARAEAETEIVRADELLKSQAARIRADQELGVQRENRDREIAVAEKNRERVIAIETERIEKDRLLEVIARERETDLSRIAKDKELEAEKREIAEAIRERIAVDRTVAEQEENIKKLRVLEEAERHRQSAVILAEGEAQEKLVKDIKAAEAAAQAAEHSAREQLTLAEARQRAAELDAAASIRLAEGRQAEAAADGLAEVQVRERDAAALEKTGRAEAVVRREKALAQAEEIEKLGLAQAVADREQAQAQAEKVEKVGLAQALADREKAMSEATQIREKLKAEAEGITDKAEAMAALDDATRDHEEYRLRLEAEKEVRLAGIDVQRRVAEAQASVLGKGLESADIDIVGGDGMFFDRIVNSISVGKAVDGFMENSATAQSLAGAWLDGSQDFTRDLSRLLGSVDSEDVRNLTLSALLLKLIDSGGPDSAGLSDLLRSARRLGVADKPLSELDAHALKR